MDWMLFSCSNSRAYKRINDKFDIHCRWFAIERVREKECSVRSQHLHNNVIRCTPESVHVTRTEKSGRKLIRSFICSVLLCMLLYLHAVHKCKFDSQVYKSPHSIVINCIRVETNNAQMKSCSTLNRSVQRERERAKNISNCNYTILKVPNSMA